MQVPSTPPAPTREGAATPPAPAGGGGFRPGPVTLPTQGPTTAEAARPRPPLTVQPGDGVRRDLLRARLNPFGAQMSARERVVALGLCVGLGLFGLTTVGTALWQLWLSDVYTQREQQALLDELDAADSPTFVSASGQSLLSMAAATSTTAGPAPAETTTTLPGPDPYAVPAGEPVARITAPKIGLDWAVVAGVGVPELKKGPGWMPGTPAPGEAGNSVISGHRTTYGAPFNRIDELAPGDQIIVSLPGRPDAVYEVRGQLIVTAKDVWVAAPTGGARLTLTSCHPKGSARQRIIVQAELISGPAASVALPADQWQLSQPPT